MGSRQQTLSRTMYKIASVLLALASLSTSLPQTKFLNCQECIFEMQHLSFLIKQEANVFEAYLTENYCPGLGEFAEQCENEMVGHYTQALFMVVPTESRSTSPPCTR